MKVLMTATAKKNQADSKKQYVLKLYITGANKRSLRAISNLDSIQKEFLQGRCNLEVVDMYRAPAAASRANIIAAPTLVKELPLPVRRLIGDLSQRNRVLLLLDLKPGADAYDEYSETAKPAV